MGELMLVDRYSDTPSGAGYYLRREVTNGWSFWLVDPKTKKSLASVRRSILGIVFDSEVIDDDDDETRETM